MRTLIPPVCQPRPTMPKPIFASASNYLPPLTTLESRLMLNPTFASNYLLTLPIFSSSLMSASNYLPTLPISASSLFGSNPTFPSMPLMPHLFSNMDHQEIERKKKISSK